MNPETLVDGSNMVVYGMRAKTKLGSNLFFGRSVQKFGEDAVLCRGEAGFGSIRFAGRRFLTSSALFALRVISRQHNENDVPETQVLSGGNPRASANFFALNPTTISAVEVGYPQPALRDGNFCVTSGDTSVIDDQIAFGGAPDDQDAGFQQEIPTKKRWRN
jgi:hypothetical protein